MPRRARRASLTRALIIAAVGLSACAPALRGPQGMPLTERDVREDGRLLAMLDTRSVDTTLVDAILASPAPARRARAALAVGQNAVRARYSTLRRLLVDADTAVAANAAFAMGLARDTAGIVALGRALAGAPDAVAREAAWALGEIGEPARTVVGFALGEGAANARVASTAAQRAPVVRAELLIATAKIRSMPVAVVTAWLDDTADVVVRAAAYSLGRTRAPAAVRSMLGVSAHRDEGVRQHVARLLARQTAGDSLGTRAQTALAALAGDTSPRVRANAARGVVSFGAEMRTQVDKLLRDPDGNVRVAAAEGIGTVFNRDASLWRAAWERDTTYIVRRNLLSGARRARTDALAAQETAWLADPDWRFRAAVIDARGGDTTETARALGARLLDDPDGRVRAAAVGLLPAAGSDATVRATYVRLLGDSDISVRASAAGALARAPRVDELPAVLDAYARSTSDTDGDARNAALRFVAALWDRDSTRIDAAARDRLRTIAMPSDAASRAIVTRIGALSAWRNTPAVTRPAAEYERIARRSFAPSSRLPRAVLRTSRGDVTMELLTADAPLVVDAFVKLANQGFYRNTIFHRVVPNFVVQDGDPRGDGSGGPGFSLRDAYTRQRHERGCLGLATAGPDTGSSQYYLCHSPQPHLDGHYTVFGRVISGFDVMDSIVQGDRVIGVDIR